MESLRGGNPETEPDQPEQTLAELEAELLNLRIWTSIQHAGIESDMARIRARVNKLVQDEKRMEQIKKLLIPPPEV